MPGMKDKIKKTINVPPNDIIDKLIYDRKVFIKGVIISKPYDVMFVLLGGNLSKPLGEEFAFKLSEFPNLRSASEQKLNNWELVADGIGIHWKDLDEDLSLKGFIRSALKKLKKETESKEYKELTAVI